MFNKTDILFFLPMILIMWFLIFLPKRKEQQALNKMLSELKKGDRVLTQAGIIGEVAGIKDNVITLKVGDGVRMEFLKSSISRLMDDEKAKDKDEAKKPVEAKA
jgi:preprotein translocase subunit YajC